MATGGSNLCEIVLSFRCCCRFLSEVIAYSLVRIVKIIMLRTQYISFTNLRTYYMKCKELDILPISLRFDFKDLLFFHSVFYTYSVVKMPNYLQPFSGSRLRSSHFDRLSIVSNILPRTPQNLNTEHSCMGISKSFFYRAHLAWNKLPLDLRDIGAPSKFKKELLTFIWNDVAKCIISEYEAENLFFD